MCGGGGVRGQTCNPGARRLMLDALKRRLASPQELGAERAAALWAAVDELVVKAMLSVEGSMHAALCGTRRRSSSRPPLCGPF